MTNAEMQEEMAEKIPKEAVSYMHRMRCDYTCGECPMFISRKNNCVLHGYGDVFLSFDGCNFFVQGAPDQMGGDPRQWVTKDESGATRSNYGFSCKRCEHFDPITWDCIKVDKDSKGDDQGIIHPDACCNDWEADPVRAFMETETLRSVINMPDVMMETGNVNPTGYR